MEVIEWRDIIGFEGRYKVSNDGQVKSLSRESCGQIGNRSMCRMLPDKIMKLHDWRGYSLVWLRKPSIHKKFRVHCLVALAFIPNPLNKPEVNHKDKNRKNCYVSNLEWCTHMENVRHRDGLSGDNVPF